MTEGAKRNIGSDDSNDAAGTGVGAVVGGAAGGVAGGAAAGAAVGGMTGPVGAAVGAAVGAVAGALVGKGIAKADPAVEDAYWRENYASRQYARGSTYDEYRPAYGYGVDAYTRYPNRSFDEVEPELARDWNNRRGKSNLEWDRAKLASRDAWQRLSDAAERVTPGDSDRDGK
jgi:hypothetical protein